MTTNPGGANALVFSDVALSRRLERTEGSSCAQFAAARARLFPASGATWIECAGAYAVFDGVESPVTQTFGLGLFEDASAEALDRIEEFFRARGSPTFHEVSPFAGPGTLHRLCDRGYRPVEISTVLVRPVAPPFPEIPEAIEVRAIAPHEAPLWSEITARGWSAEHPELRDFLLGLGAIMAAGDDTVCFLATIDGQPGAAGVLRFHGKTALFGGAATVPEMRRRGLQGALLGARMRWAHQRGCDIAMMVAATGSDSQRNAERMGFRIAYTRTKWRSASST
jgi:GNAT superfamily N-acetyltransferase